jgi:hypothetical protein
MADSRLPYLWTAWTYQTKPSIPEIERTLHARLASHRVRRFARLSRRLLILLPSNPAKKNNLSMLVVV